MALGKKCGSNVKRPNEGLGLEFVRYTRSFGRKRIVISNNMVIDATVTTPTKKQCCEILNSEKSLLEALPQDILIRILCGVNHDDLKQLFHVSKLIREATLIAKQWHFAYSTPTKTSAFRDSIDLGDSTEFDEVEAPNAPKQLGCYRSRLNGKKLADISVALFAAPDEEQWPRKEIFMETEI
uniref:F-box domain-containing protein n=1 Tax=Davidia involucrata TaxID=16924 RepID=A0A5B6ZYY7_DAVIN